MRVEHTLTYKGQLSDQIGTRLGPSVYDHNGQLVDDEYYVVVEQSYDAKTKKTKLGVLNEAEYFIEHDARIKQV